MKTVAGKAEGGWTKVTQKVELDHYMQAEPHLKPRDAAAPSRGGGDGDAGHPASLPTPKPSKKKKKHGHAMGPVVVSSVAGFDLGDPASRTVQHSRQIINEAKLRKGNAFKTVKAAVFDTFTNPKSWKKVVGHVELEQYLQMTKCMTDPKILDSRKRSVDYPSGAACNIDPMMLPRPLDKCELFKAAQADANKARLRQLEAERQRALKDHEAAQQNVDVMVVEHD